MASVVIAGDVSGTCTLQAANAAGTTVLTLPTTSGTLVSTNGSPTFVTVTSTTDNTTTLNATTGNITTVTAGLGNATAPSITFTGDTNTGIFSPTADTIAFTEGGTESMRIDASGNLGIGTSSPGDRIHAAASVAAGLSLQATGTGGSTWRFLSTDNAASIGGGYLGFNNGSYRMVIDSSGNVFVGGTTQNTSTNPVYAKNTAKAWVQFVGSSGSVNQSFNVSSVTRNATGQYTVNYTSALANANPTIVGTINGNTMSFGNSALPSVVNGTNTTTTSVLWVGYTTGGSNFTANDYTAIGMVAFD